MLKSVLHITNWHPNRDNPYEAVWMQRHVESLKKLFLDNLPATTDVIALAVQYDTMFFTTPLDYSGLNLETIPAWVGSRPIKRP